MAYPTRNSSSYTLPYLSGEYLATEAGDVLATEDGNTLVVESATYNPNLTSRNSSSYTLPNRN